METIVRSRAERFGLVDQDGLATTISHAAIRLGAVMRKSKFSESQIVGILKDAESGVPVADLLPARSNVLEQHTQEQVLALGRLGWTLSRIGEATGVVYPRWTPKTDN